MDQEPGLVAPLAMGQILDQKYKVGQPMGGGAMGLIYEAQHLLLQKPVAVKVLRPEMAAQDDVRERFQAEARAAAAIGHPNIISVTDMGRTPDGALYFVMDRLRGETLGERLERVGRIKPTTAVAIATEVLSGLAAAHELGLIHRDIKPDNIFFAQFAGGRETPRILDFGVAKALASVGKRAQGTRAGFTVGTPQFMAPEQAAGAADVDARVDVYAMGVVMYNMLAGRVPFDGDDVMQVLTAVVSGAAPPLRDLCPEAPADLVREVEAGMNRDRRKRPASASEFAARLQAAVGVAPARKDTPPPGATIVDLQAYGALEAPILVEMAAGRHASHAALRIAELNDPDADLTGPVLELDRPDPPAAPEVTGTMADELPAAPVTTDQLASSNEIEPGPPVTAPPRKRRLGLLLLPIPLLAGAAIFFGMRSNGDDQPATAAVSGDERVIVQFDVFPPASAVLLDGRPTTNPAQLTRGSVHKLAASFAGYESREIAFTADGKPVKVELEKLEKPAPRAKR